MLNQTLRNCDKSIRQTSITLIMVRRRCESIESNDIGEEAASNGRIVACPVLGGLHKTSRTSSEHYWRFACLRREAISLPEDFSADAVMQNAGQPLRRQASDRPRVRAAVVLASGTTSPENNPKKTYC